jgi:hypothetical protein
MEKFLNFMYLLREKYFLSNQITNRNGGRSETLWRAEASSNVVGIGFEMAKSCPPAPPFRHPIKKYLQGLFC